MIYHEHITIGMFASSGTYSELGNASVSWTLGDNFIKTFEISSGIQTLGFHQTFLEVSLAETPLLGENMQLRVCPNFLDSSYL